MRISQYKNTNLENCIFKILFYLFEINNKSMQNQYTLLSYHFKCLTATLLNQNYKTLQNRKRLIMGVMLKLFLFSYKIILPLLHGGCCSLPMPRSLLHGPFSSEYIDRNTQPYLFPLISSCACKHNERGAVHLPAA